MWRVSACAVDDAACPNLVLGGADRARPPPCGLKGQLIGKPLAVGDGAGASGRADTGEEDLDLPRDKRKGHNERVGPGLDSTSPQASRARRMCAWTTDLGYRGLVRVTGPP